MSYLAELTMNRSLAKAALSLDVLEAAINHQLPKDAKKLRSLSDVIKDHADRFKKLAEQQSVFSLAEFNERAIARVHEMRKERKIAVQLRAERRAQQELERAQLLNEQGMAAAA